MEFGDGRLTKGWWNVKGISMLNACSDRAEREAARNPYDDDDTQYYSTDIRLCH